MDIRILPSNIANMIAAGEVVQRPSSVVKELMENALDALSDSVTVIIKDSGRTLIQVIDNGCGMSPSQAEICFERHATSKISSPEDLQRILTFGFRGEALASIAAVSEVTLKTRREEDEVGVQVEVAASKILSSSSVATPKGSNFEVRNLFYNVPARRKFLKSDNVEFRHIVEEFSRVALTRPDVSFTLTHNGRDVHVLKRAKSLKHRIQDLLGKNSVDRIVELEADTAIVNVSGFVARPDSARKTSLDQYFFVNGRYFRSPYLHKAVMKAYEDMISDGLNPSYFIYLEIDPSQMDVNIHPTKTEVKFENESVLFQTLYACVREALGKNSFLSSLDFEGGGEADQVPVFGSKFSQYRPDVFTPDPKVDDSFNPFEGVPGIDPGAPSSPSSAHPSYVSQGGGTEGGYYRGRPSGKGHYDGLDNPALWPSLADPDRGPQGLPDAQGQGELTPPDAISSSGDYGALFEQRSLPLSNIITLSSKYIVSPVKSGLLVVNIRRATERIAFERYLKALSKNAHVSQATLIPVEIVVGVSARLTFEANKEVLSDLGFSFECVGEDRIVVNGIPETFSADPSAVESLMADVLIALEGDSSLVSSMMLSSTAEKFARLSASRGKGPMNLIEAQGLLDALFSCQNSEFTSRGQRIMTILPLEELDAKFQ